MGLYLSVLEMIRPLDTVFLVSPAPLYRWENEHLVLNSSEQSSSAHIAREGSPLHGRALSANAAPWQTPPPTVSAGLRGTYLHNKGHNEIAAEHNDDVDPPQNRSAEQLAGDRAAQLV